MRLKTRNDIFKVSELSDLSLTLDVPTLVQGELSTFCAQKSASVDEQNSLYWMYHERNIQESYKELAIFWAQKTLTQKEKIC